MFRSLAFESEPTCFLGSIGAAPVRRFRGAAAAMRASAKQQPHEQGLAKAHAHALGKDIDDARLKINAHLDAHPEHALQCLFRLQNLPLADDPEHTAGLTVARPIANKDHWHHTFRTVQWIPRQWKSRFLSFHDPSMARCLETCERNSVHKHFVDGIFHAILGIHENCIIPTLNKRDCLIILSRRLEHQGSLLEQFSPHTRTAEDFIEACRTGLCGCFAVKGKDKFGRVVVAHMNGVEAQQFIHVGLNSD